LEAALVLSGLLLGAAGAPHCLAMCAAPCRLVIGQGRAGATWAFHSMRLAGYALAGALMASGVAAMSALGGLSPALRPLWTLAHVAALALGVWLLWQGRQPAWLDRVGRQGARGGPGHEGWQALTGPARSATIGLAWVAWPCGLLQSALVVAALANGPIGGAAVMLAFGLATASSLLLGPALWVRLGRGGSAISTSMGARFAGALLAGASAWSIGSGVWQSGLAYCFG